MFEHHHCNIQTNLYFHKFKNTCWCLNLETNAHFSCLNLNSSNFRRTRLGLIDNMQTCFFTNPKTLIAVQASPRMRTIRVPPSTAVNPGGQNWVWLTTRKKTYFFTNLKTPIGVQASLRMRTIRVPPSTAVKIQAEKTGFDWQHTNKPFFS